MIFRCPRCAAACIDGVFSVPNRVRLRRNTQAQNVSQATATPSGQHPTGVAAAPQLAPLAVMALGEPARMALAMAVDAGWRRQPPDLVASVAMPSASAAAATTCALSTNSSHVPGIAFVLISAIDFAEVAAKISRKPSAHARRMWRRGQRHRSAARHRRSRGSSIPRSRRHE